MSGRLSEGTVSALDLLQAIGPLHGSERPDVGLRPYLLNAHSHARINTAFMPHDGIAVSHPRWMPVRASQETRS